MEKVSLIRMLGLLVVLTLVAACGGSGTVIGNPGTRSFSGALAVQSSASLTVTQQNDAVPESCPAANGPITVVLSTPAGDEVTVEESATGDFSTEINQEQRYEVVFQQGGTTCAELNYASSDRLAGLHVVLGKGTQNIDVGTVTDQGGGVYVSSNDPSSYCDDDGDGITDNLDTDANGDGVEDSDSNGDGVIDGFFENETMQ